MGARVGLGWYEGLNEGQVGDHVNRWHCNVSIKDQ